MILDVLLGHGADDSIPAPNDAVELTLVISLNRFCIFTTARKMDWTIFEKDIGELYFHAFTIEKERERVCVCMCLCV